MPDRHSPTIGISEEENYDASCPIYTDHTFTILKASTLWTTVYTSLPPPPSFLFHPIPSLLIPTSLDPPDLTTTE